MKKIYFSALISCSLLLAAAQTNGQSFGQDENAPIHQNHVDHSSLYAYLEDDNVIVLRWSTGNESEVDRYVIEKSTDSVHFNSLHEVVARANVPMSRIDLVVRTGGSSQIVAVKQLLEKMFPDKVTEHDPFTSVAGGLAIANYHGYRWK